jgi:regulation of enolase protein 1 (concanavalin A-like superfamily)
MTRSSAGGPTAFVAGGSTSIPVWLKLSRRDDMVTGYTSADGVSWTTVGNTSAPTGDSLVGFAVTSHDTSGRNTSTFDNVGLWRLPPGWSQTDVGAVGLAGSGTATDGVFTVTGAGSDIWGTADSFNAVTQSVSGDATVIGRVVDEQNTHTFAKAGVTLGSLTPNGARVIIDVRPNGSVEFMARLADDEAMSFIAGAATAFPVWLKLARSGDQCTGSISSDGSTWTPVGSVTVVMPGTVSGGLAVTSHDPAVLNTSTFDNVMATSRAFQDGDVGAVGQPGNARFSDGGVTIQGAGADIWGTPDAFHFLYSR